MLRVCIITDTFYPIITGDVVRVIKDVQVIKKLGHRVTIISPQKGIREIECHKINSSRFLLLIGSTLIKVLKIHRISRINIIWCNRYYQVFFLLPLSRLIGAKLICEIHGPEKKQVMTLTSSTKKIFYNSIYSISEFLLRFTDKIIIVEEELKGWLEKELHLPKDKIIFIGNYPNLSVFKPRKRNTSEKFTVGYLGTLQKNRIEPLLDLVAKKKKGYHFMIIGDGEDKQKVRDIKEITHLVENDYQKIPQHLRKFDLGIIFSLSTDVVFSEKGPPIKLFEYLACGIPVLAVNIPNLKPLIEGNGVGLVVEKDKLEQGIEKMKNNYVWYKTNVLKFREKMKKYYSWRNEKKKIAQILESFRGK